MFFTSSCPGIYNSPPFTSPLIGLFSKIRTRLALLLVAFLLRCKLSYRITITESIEIIGILCSNHSHWRHSQKCGFHTHISFFLVLKNDFKFILLAEPIKCGILIVRLEMFSEEIPFYLIFSVAVIPTVFLWGIFHFLFPVKVNEPIAIVTTADCHTEHFFSNLFNGIRRERNPVIEKHEFGLVHNLFEDDFNWNRICVFRIVLLVEMDEHKLGVYLNTSNILKAVIYTPSAIDILHAFLKEAVVNFYSIFKYHISFFLWLVVIGTK